MSPPLSPHDIGLLTLTEASEIAGLPVSTIRVWITRYGLRTTRVLGEVMLCERSFLDCERNRRTFTGKPRKAVDRSSV